MKEIVERLKENRETELARKIVESAGYKVTKRSSEKLHESAGIIKGDGMHYNEELSNSEAIELYQDISSKPEDYGYDEGVPEVFNVILDLLKKNKDSLYYIDISPEEYHFGSKISEDGNEYIREGSVMDEDGNEYYGYIDGNRDGMMNFLYIPSMNIEESKKLKRYYVNFLEPEGKLKGKYVDKEYSANSAEEAEEMFKKEYPGVKKADYTVIKPPKELEESQNLKEAYDEDNEEDRNMFDAISSTLADRFGFDDLTPQQEQEFNKAVEMLVGIKTSGGDSTKKDPTGFNTIFREFTKQDWYGFGGAEKLPDGSGPFYAENDEAIFIISGDDDGGSMIEVLTGEYPDEKSYQGFNDSVDTAKEEAVDIFQKISSGSDIDSLLKNKGFTRIM